MATRVLIVETDGAIEDIIFPHKPTFKDIYPKIKADLIEPVKGKIEIDTMKGIRKNMLSNKASKHCSKCYDQEQSGFFSLRLSSNKHFGHNISMTENTKSDGTADFIIKY